MKVDSQKKVEVRGFNQFMSYILWIDFIDEFKFSSLWLKLIICFPLQVSVEESFYKNKNNKKNVEDVALC